MDRLCAFAFALAVAVGLAATAGALGPVTFGPDLAAEGWETVTFRGRVPAEFRADGADGLRIRSDKGVSVVYRTLASRFGPAEAARWRWRVEAGVPPTDLARRGGDDRDIALYFLFANDARAAENPPTTLTGALLRGRALIYVWGGDAAAGQVIASPHMAGRGQILVRRPAASATGAWIDETADLRADFRRVFGREPGPLVAVAVSSDSDDTGRLIEARLADLTLR